MVGRQECDQDRTGRTVARQELDDPRHKHQSRQQNSSSTYPIKICPGAHPACYIVDTGALCRGQSGWGMALTTHPHLALRLNVGYSYTSTLMHSMLKWTSL
jgi:hypothetical protein